MSTVQNQLLKLLASDGASNDSFGCSASISGNYAIIGANADDSWKGSAYIFEFDGSTWTQKQKLTASDRAQDNFGFSVSLSGNYAIVGAYDDDDNSKSNSGSAYIFERDTNGSWTQKQKLLASDPNENDFFGRSVAISGDYAIVSSYYDDDNNKTNSGSAYIFERGTNGTWTQKQKLTASDGEENDYFGWYVAISGNYAAVSSTANNSWKGAVYIFELDTNGTWTQKNKLIGSDSANNDYLGYSLAMSEDYIIAGANYNDTSGNSSGTAYIFERDANNNWGTVVNGETYRTESKKLLASDAQNGDEFGHSVGINGNYAIVGAKFNDDNGFNSGSAYFYERDANGNWGTAVNGETYRTETKKFLASDGAYNSQLGYSVAVEGDYAIIAAAADDSWKGAAYIFKIIPTTRWLKDISNNFLTSTSLVSKTDVDTYFSGITEIASFNQTESNTFFTDLSNNSFTNAIMSYIGFKIIKITPSLGEIVTNSLYTSLDTANDSFTFDNLVEATTNSIFDASNNADISGGDTTPTSIEKSIFKNAKTLSFRKLRKDLKSTELETKIKDISTEDNDDNLMSYLNNINKNLSLDLTGFDLSGVDLTGTDLSGATLVDTDLSGANLTNANLASVDISGANLTNANFKNATFTDISNVQSSTGTALNVPYTYQYFNNQLTQSTTILTHSYTTNKTKIGPFKDGESISVNGVQLTFGSGISQAGLLGVNKSQEGDSFTFLQDDNNITSWGNPYTGGNQPSDISNVKAIYSTKRAKTALYEDGKIMSWGDSDYGGDTPSNVSGIIDIKANEKAFVGLYHNGNILCWGDSSTGGTAPSDISNVVQLYANKNAFSALSSDGTIKSWGTLNNTTAPTDNKFVEIFSTDTAFAGLKSDGTVKCWGSSDSNQNTPPNDLSNVSVIFSNQTAFAALLGDSTVQCWGNTTNGGTTPTDISNVDSIYCTNSAFTALLKDGNIVCWGDSNNGGTKPIKNENYIKTEDPIIVKMAGDDVFRFDNIPSTESNLSFTTNHASPSERDKVGFISGSSLYLHYRGYSNDNNTNYGKVFISNNEFDTNLGSHSFVFKTFPYRKHNSSPKFYIGFILNYGSSYYNKYTTGLFNVNTSENPYVYIDSPQWIYNGQWELTFTISNTGLTVTGAGGTISVVNSVTNGGKYRLVVNIVDGSMFELKNAFTTPYPKLEYGKKYKFSQSHWSNTGYTLKFSSSDLDYALIEKSESFGVPGNAGAYTTLHITDDNIQQLYVYSKETGFSSGKRHKVVQFEVKKIVVTVVNNKFVFDGDQYTTPEINHDTIYIFDVSDSSNDGHPLSFSKESTVLREYNVNRTGKEGTEGAIVTFKNNDINNTKFYVFCKLHGLNMGSYYNPINISNILQRNIVNNFKKIYSTQTAFAGLKNDGTIITWGNTDEGGTFPLDSNSSPPNLTNKYETDITDVVHNTYYFKAININDGLINYGIDLDNTNILKKPPYTNDDIKKLAYDISKVAYTIETGSTAVLKRDGKIICFSNEKEVADVIPVKNKIFSKCVDVVGSRHGFCAIKEDRTIFTWGHSTKGAVNNEMYDIKNVKKVVSTSYSFAALSYDGSVISWGHNGNGESDRYGAAAYYQLVEDDIKSDVIDIISNRVCFVAIKDDGTGNGTYKLVNWGGEKGRTEGNYIASDTTYGVRQHSGVVDDKILNSGIKKIYKSHYSFVIIKSDNKAYIWGKISDYIKTLAELSQLTNVKEVVISDYAIAFLKYDGSVVAHGSASYGGEVDHTSYGVRDYSGVINPSVLDSNIVKLFSNFYCFCALTNDGKVYSWGNNDHGGNYHHTGHGLPPHLTINDLTDIVKVTGSYDSSVREDCEGGFACLKRNGEIVFWGHDCGAIKDSNSNMFDISKNSFVDIKPVYHDSGDYSNYYALHRDGSLHSFGYNKTLSCFPYVEHINYNHSAEDNRFTHSYIPGSYRTPKTVLRWDTERVEKYVPPTETINSNFVNVFSTDKAFAGLKKDGTILVWGDNGYGGNQTDVTEQKNIQHIFSNSASFTAVKQDNSMFVWGKKGYGIVEATTSDINISSNLQEINSYIEPYRKSNLLTMFNVHTDTRKILEESYNSNESANIILKTDGTATTWGNTTHGGVSSNLTLTNVKEVVTGGNNMSVLKSDGSLATWSNNTDQNTTATNVKKVVSGLSGNVIALKADGTVEYWHPDLANWTIGSNIDTAKLSDLSGVVDVFAFDNTFAALDKNDALTVWGDKGQEPDFTQIKDLVSDDITASDMFGASVSIDNNYIVVGAHGNDDGGNAAGSVYIFGKNEGGTNNWGQIKKLTATDASANDNLGQSVYINGNYILASAMGDDTLANYSGAVYIFHKDEGGVDNWGQLKKLLPTDNDISDYYAFGRSVDMYGDYIIVGASMTNITGGILIFKKDYDPLTPNDISSNAWGQLKIITGSSVGTNHYSSYSIGIYEDYIVMGSNQGAYIFQKDEGGVDNWGEIKKINQSTQRFGQDVSIYKDYIIISSAYEHYDGKSDSGAVYIYKKDYDPLTPNDISNNAWGQIKKLTANDPFDNAQFGLDVTINDEFAIVSSQEYDISSGSIYIFKKNEGGLDNWGLIKKIKNSNGAVNDFLGYGLEIYNNTFIAGAFGRDDNGDMSGRAYVYDYNAGDGPNLLTNISSKATQLSSGVKEVIANSKVLIALKYDGTVVTQGDSTLGGDISNSNAQYKLYGGTADNIAKVYLNNKFAMALKKDRTCVYWGDISRNSTLFNFDISAFTNIKDIVYSNDVMVGIKYDGSIVALGEKSKGGALPYLIKNVQKILATTNNGFTALKTDGSLVVWGDTNYGGQL